MTNEEAVEVLEDLKVKINIPKAAELQRKRNEAIDMAIEALNNSEIPNSSDTVYRQDALDALGEEPPVWYDGEDEIAEREQWRRDIAAIKAVPSAQPEIVQCKDCRDYTDDYCRRFGDDYGADFYCGFAERRTDE